MSSKIILLNGCSSAGKSSISEKIMELSEEPWLNFSLSTFWNALSPKYKGFGEKSNEGFQFIPRQNEQGFPINEIKEIKINSYGEKIFNSMPKVFKQLVDDGHDLIIEEVILEKKYLENYKKYLKGHQVYFVSVSCELPVLEKREKLRGDRVIGSNYAQYFKIKDLNWKYDLKIDSSHVSALSSAKKILKFIELSSCNNFI
jgi:chloramphenicol 3-O phosphotransferase